MPLALLMGDHINGGFSIEKCMAVLPGRKKVAQVITEVAVTWDSTVLRTGEVIT